MSGCDLTRIYILEDTRSRTGAKCECLLMCRAGQSHAGRACIPDLLMWPVTFAICIKENVFENALLMWPVTFAICI